MFVILGKMVCKRDCWMHLGKSDVHMLRPYLFFFLDWRNYCHRRRRDDLKLHTRHLKKVREGG